MTKEILILGTGALASLFAARLSLAGAKVTMLGSWKEGLEALRNHGIRLIEADGSEHVVAVRAVDDPCRCRGARYALVLVKAWQTQRAAQQLVECLHEDGLALTLQNGLNHYRTLTETLGEPRVALGVTTVGAYLAQPGVVHGVGEALVWLGAHPRLAPLAELLQAAGFVVKSEADMSTLVWGKLVINAAINPLTALLCVNNGELLQRPASRALMDLVAQEAAAVAAAQGVRLPYPDAVAAVEEVARRTAANYSSMLRDVQRGAPTEIDAINGAIVRVAEQVGQPAPLNYALWLLIRALAQPNVGLRSATAEIGQPESHRARDSQHPLDNTYGDCHHP